MTLEKLDIVPSTLHSEQFSPIYLISVEEVLKPEFSSLVNRLVKEGTLSKIFFDEAHEYLESLYRFDLLFSIQLPAPLPFIFVSGSFPNHLEKKLRHLTKRDFEIIRQSTIRTNIGYVVRLFASKEMAKNEMISLIKTSLDKIIIFTRTIQEAQSIRDTLHQNGINQTTNFHGQMDDLQKQFVVNQFVNDAVRIVVATVGFGTGL